MDRGRPKVLVITPSARGGPWTILVSVMSRAGHLRFKVVALGDIGDRGPSYSVFRIPYLNYDEVWSRVSSSTVMSVLFEAPLIAFGLLLLVVYRPKVVVGNGFLPTLALAVPARLLGARVVGLHLVAGALSGMSGPFAGICRRLGRFIDCVFVNSDEGREDAVNLVDKDKVAILEHWADAVFFEPKDRAALRRQLGMGSELVVLHVGRLDIDKNCDRLIKAAEKLGGNPDYRFLFVGVGDMADPVRDLESKHSNVKYLGYIGDREVLSRLYAAADVVSSYSGETYLALPAIEALASGTPIIIADTALISGVRKLVEKSVLPGDAGWIVAAGDAGGLVALLNSARESGITEERRTRCRDFARSKYSDSNISRVADMLDRLTRRR